MHDDRFVKRAGSIWDAHCYFRCCFVYASFLLFSDLREIELPGKKNVVPSCLAGLDSIPFSACMFLQLKIARMR